jgi:hypothetical protein
LPSFHQALADAENDLEEHKVNLVKYETQLVDLTNAADKAKQVRRRLPNGRWRYFYSLF